MVLFPAPAALGKLPYASLLDDAWPQAVMGLLRGDVVDTGRVMLGVTPGGVETAVLLGLVVVYESLGIRRGAFDGVEGLSVTEVAGGLGVTTIHSQVILFRAPNGLARRLRSTYPDCGEK